MLSVSVLPSHHNLCSGLGSNPESFQCDRFCGMHKTVPFVVADFVTGGAPNTAMQAMNDGVCISGLLSRL